jgi:alpha-mannosidase
MVTVHIIVNAHLDPIWLWPWTSGADALLATCRSACDRLDAHPELHFCWGEAWGYDLIDRVAPALAERIRRHIAAGRWHIVGGWWLQPDCNGPSGFALRQQIALGRAYLQAHYGQFPRTAYNVDSFGHAASLPEILRAAGQDRYVLMRPQEHELALPARLFRWRGYAGGPEVVTFRIAGAYATGPLTVAHVERSLTELPPGIQHTMCFVGLGDHGGGPTEEQIAWIAAHRDALPGCRLEYSWPDRFFDAVADRTDHLPLVTGELQYHAVGCYSVQRAVKVAVRRAEHALAQAEVAAAGLPQETDADVCLLAAWRRVCSHHFHDTYGGTCIPSAYDIVLAQLGAARATADEIIQLGLRRRLEDFPNDPCHRIVLYNADDDAYDDYAQYVPWFEYGALPDGWRLVDEAGRDVPVQLLQPEAMINWDGTYFVRLLFSLQVAPGGFRVLRIVRPGQPCARLSDGAAVPPPPTHPPAQANDTTLTISAHHASVCLAPGTAKLALADGLQLPLPDFELIDDPTDTWSHGVDRYGPALPVTVQWDTPRVIDGGPLRASLRRAGRLADSHIVAEYRVYAGRPAVDLRLRVHWTEERRLLKLAFTLPAPLTRRWDGIPDGELLRPADGREYPLRDHTLLELADGRRLGVVCPDVFALDVTPQRVRLTLVRSPLMAHHDPYPQPGPRAVHADQGMHEFRLRILAGAPLTGAQLDRAARAWQRPLAGAELTRGMPRA